MNEKHVYKEYYLLPVYKELRLLAIQIRASTQKLSKTDKDVFLVPMLQYCQNIAENIYCVTSEKNNVKIIDIIDNMIRLIRDVMIINRFIFDIKIIKQKGFNSISYHIQNILRQLIGWRNSYTPDQNN